MARRPVKWGGAGSQAVVSPDRSEAQHVRDLVKGDFSQIAAAGRQVQVFAVEHHVTEIREERVAPDGSSEVRPLRLMPSVRCLHRNAPDTLARGYPVRCLPARDSHSDSGWV